MTSVETVNNAVATIGFFDGVHKGHQFVVRQVVDEARRRGLQAVSVTFDRPPREVLTGRPCPLLTTLDEKKSLLLQAGADRCEILPFTPELAALSAKDFMLKILKNRLNVKVLMLGYDNRFGHREPCGGEHFDDDLRCVGELGMELIRLPEKEVPEVSAKCSSSSVRKALGEGDVGLAAELLGRPYRVAGRVVHGRGEGRRLNFPTANLAPETIATVIPATGVYAVRVRTAGETDGESPEKGRIGMMNIGTRPTFDGDTLSLEVHLFHFSGNLYGQRLAVDFLRRVRDEQAFSSPEALRRQLEKDRISIISEFNPSI